MSTVVEEPSPSMPAPPPTSSEPQMRQANREGPKNILYVRPWDGVTSTVEAFAIVRSIERRYGRLKWFHFLRVCQYRLLFY